MHIDPLLHSQWSQGASPNEGRLRILPFLVMALFKAVFPQ